MEALKLGIEQLQRERVGQQSIASRRHEEDFQIENLRDNRCRQSSKLQVPQELQSILE